MPNEPSTYEAALLELRKRELDIQDRTVKQSVFRSPLMVAVVGGLITLAANLVVNYYKESGEFEKSLAVRYVEQATAILSSDPERTR